MQPLHAHLWLGRACCRWDGVTAPPEMRCTSDDTAGRSPRVRDQGSVGQALRECWEPRSQAPGTEPGFGASQTLGDYRLRLSGQITPTGPGDQGMNIPERLADSHFLD